MPRALIVATTAMLTGFALPACGPEGPLDPAAPGRAPLTRASFSHVIEGGGRFWIVLDREVDPARTRVDPEVVSRSPLLVVRAGVAERTLPDEALAWNGQAVHLHDNRGRLCGGVVRGFAVVGRLAPVDWDGYPEEDDLPRPVTREIWELSEPVLAAEVHPTSGRCEGASWARAADEEAPRIAQARPAPPRIASAALAALRGLSGYAEIERRYLQPELGAPVVREVPWEHFDGAEPTVTLIEDAARRSATVVVTASSGAFCGEFGGQLTAVFRLESTSGEPRLERLGELEALFVPEAAADLDGDGVPEVLVLGGVLHLAAGLATQEVLSLPFHGCPC